jgi:hypothetical protein
MATGGVRQRELSRVLVAAKVGLIREPDLQTHD